MEIISQVKFWIYFIGSLIPPILIYIFIRWLDRRLQTAVAEGAASRGWEADFSRPRPVAFALRGRTQEIPWEMAAMHGRGKTLGGTSATRSAGLYWTTEAVKLPGKVILIAPMPKGKLIPKFSPKGFVGSFIVPLILKNFLGPDAGDLSAVEPVELIPPGLKENFIVLSNDPAQAQSFLQGKAAGILLQWNEQPEPRIKAGIVLWHKGLQVRFGEAIRDFHLLDQIVNFGTRLAQSLK